MKTRTLTIVASVTLLCLTSGCGAMRQCWFGRGARCGLHLPRCTPLRGRCHGPAAVTPPGNFYPVAPAPVATVPVAPAPVAVAPAPMCPTCPTPAPQPMVVAPPAGCGCEVAPPVYAPEPVCGFESYGGFINDPYLSGGVVTEGVVGNGVIVDNGMVIDNGMVMGDGMVMGEYPSGTSIQGTTVPDNFSTRIDSQGYQSNKYDTDGARIISEEPLPPGVVPVN